MRRPLVLLLAACACTCARAGDDPAALDSDEARAAMPPANTIPCNHPEYWSHSLSSASLPLTVHYMASGDKAMARRVLGDLEQAWRVEVDGLGFRPPPSDAGRCGSDGAFDAWLWRGHKECFVDVLDAAPGATWDAHIGYMVVDPWGPYGGDILESTVAHELNHAMQMADDWNDCPIVYEMTADFIQKIVVPSDENYREYFDDFQSRPQWSIDRNDHYQTWYSYGAALYLFFLRDAHFGGDPRFVAEMWLRMRNPPGADEDATINHPSFEDALDGMLRARAGIGFLDSVVEFARWRFTQSPAPAAQHAPARAGRVALTPAPMILGTSYVVLDGDGAADLDVGVDGDPGVRWVAQKVSAADGSVAVAVTALPLDPAAYEPNKQHDHHWPATVVLR